MPKKKSFTARRVFTLLLAYIMLCVGGGAVVSLMFLPAVFGANSVAKAVVPSLKVEGVDFDVTAMPQKSVMYASDGTTKIADFYADNRTVVPLKNISKAMQRAVVAREDRRFFQHHGVDVQGVMRAFFQTFVKKGDTQGGSTLTQQYVKNVLAMQAREDDDPIAEYHATEQTIARKVREMLIAVQMEKQYTKWEILQGYLNIAQFGNHNLYGVETAAKRYFNTSAKDLTVIQAATIAAITKNPAKYDPTSEGNLKASEEQRNIVLKLMLDQDYISQAEYDKDVKIPLKDTLNVQSIDSGCQVAGDAAFFCDYVTRQILKNKEFGATEEERSKLLKEGGLTIVTTMDVNANSIAMQTARNTIPPDDPTGFEVTMAVIRPGTGEVLGFGLNRTYDATDRAKTDSTRTAVNYAVDQVDGGGWGFNVGSTWKPINLVAWMQQGKSINQALSTSTNVSTRGFSCNGIRFTTNWHVENSGGGTVSSETPLQGLIKSHNTTQAAMASQITLCPIADAAKAMGYHNSIKGHEDIYDSNSFQPPMVIGTVQASPLTMANVYATIAANGVECTPIAITKMTDRSGKEYKVPSANCHQAIDSGVAQTAAYALNQGVVTKGGNAELAQLDDNRKTFAKTGTNEKTYMLTGGFIPQVSAYVAVGNAEEQQSFSYKTINGVYHSTWYGMYIAEPAWREFMQNYVNAAGIPINNDYGNPDSRFMTASYSSSGSGRRYSSSGTSGGTTSGTTGGTTGGTTSGTTGGTGTTDGTTGQ
ncbi:penicillin-binding protein [Bifidobacterium sp. CP2]|uniref:transglycosylase domain-containing protein n=1 Tax=Bifidobacterium TaxID=1678 RepID=UPI001BDBBBA6|nr:MULTISPECIES: transglycosylase domain-containing protein [Bifidobacterium]MBT1180874.1 penicillin-binding protein [Bifidobacterium sp. CP2]MBW3081208.1 penicillin-binding protein [Bifidobacterium saguinibicoloris]